VTFTLRSRLTFVYTVVFGVLLAAIATVSYRVLAYQLDADVTSSLRERTSGLHGYLRFAGGQPSVFYDPADPAEAAFVQDATRYYQIFDANTGRLLAQSDALRLLGLEFTPAEVRAFCEDPRAHDLLTDDGRIRLSNSIVGPLKGERYLLQVGISLAALDRALNRFLVLLIATVPAGLLISFAIGRGMAGVALRPLSTLADAARTVDIRHLRRRLPIRGAGDELDDVAGAFNETLARLDHALTDVRQFSTALAHDLRTPLTALRGEIEMSMASTAGERERELRLASQLEEIDKLKRMIDRILTLARAEAGEIPLTFSPIDLTALAMSLVKQLEPVAEAGNVSLRCDSSSPVMVQGDGDWLKRLILNLLDNAIKFTPPGGRVVVHVEAERGQARLLVKDSGIGIDPAAQPYIFDRFFRGDPARSPGIDGIGLGLSLAKWIVEQHHGSIDAESFQGRGSTFSVRLPVLTPFLKET